MAVQQRSRLARIALLVAGNVAVFVVLLVVLEGCSSWVVSLRELRGSGDVAERLHTRYDADLGWVSEPNVRRPAMYGPGADLNTNSRGFRGTAELSAEVAPGKTRAICSGDSFTLGYGVSDDQTWCFLLTTQDERLETVNMGQGGYGIDQAYLWYRRDARDVQHQIHLFAFITDDFRRMTRRDFMGYPKPVLAVKDGLLDLQNVPVPRRSYAGWLSRNSPAIRSLRLVELGERAFRRTRADNTASKSSVSTFDQASAVLPALLTDLKRENDARGSKLVVIYLATSYDLNAEGPRKWSAFFRQQADRVGFEFIDLFEHFRALPAERVAELFLQSSTTQFQQAAGHYSQAGNELVAKLIYDELIKRRVMSRP